MSFFKSAEPISGVKDILLLNREAGIHLINYHTAVLRQESELSIKERELIAAYVSGLNDCQYCHGVHSVTAESFGVEAGFLSEMLDDSESSTVDEKLKPILAYAKQLTLGPAKMSQVQVDAVLAAGWSEQALHDAVNVICLFNFMNRLVEGHGIEGDSNLFKERGEALRDGGYEPLLKVLKDQNNE